MIDFLRIHSITAVASAVVEQIHGICDILTS